MTEVATYHVFSWRGYSCADPEGGRGSGPPPPLENFKNIGLLSSTGPDPLKIRKLTNQHSLLSMMLGHHRPTSETPLNGVSLADR